MTTSSQSEPLDTELSELISKIFMAGYQSGKKSGLTMVIASDVIEPEAKSRLKQIIARERKQAIIDATGGISYTMPIKSVRTRNTAFKKYAVKYFNGKIQERRERMLARIEQFQKENES